MNTEPVAWGYKDFNGDISDCICPEEHDRAEGDYTIPLYTNPVKELHLSLQKSKQTGELLAVTYTDDEHRIVEVLWQRPPVKELSEKCNGFCGEYECKENQSVCKRKAQ